MKRLIVFFPLLISLITCGTQLKSQRFDVISEFNDSTTNIIAEKEFLYYTKGHHGHIWSVAVAEKGHYIIVSGNTRNNDFRVDTISANIPILKWGLDTMALCCHKMEPIDNPYYWPFYERLVLFSSQKEIIFDCSETNSYSGTDSVTFNKNLNELKYLMYWLANSKEIRNRLPSPL